MQQSFERALTASERRRLRADLGQLARRQAPAALRKEVLQVLLASLVVGLGFGLFSSHGWPVSLGATPLVGLLILVLSRGPRLRTERRRMQRLQAALEADRAQVRHIVASGFVEVEELSDLGAFYLFQTGPDELLVLRGQDYYATEAFPCLEFELVTVPDVLFHIRPLSPRVPPAQVLPAAAMRELAGVEDGLVLPGRLDQALAALRAARTAQTE